MPDGEGTNREERGGSFILTPVLHPVTQDRLLSLILVVLPLIVVVFSLFDITLWHCPLHQLTGLRCPGCGLTRSLRELVLGNFRDSFSFHPFALVFALAWVLLCLRVLLPRGMSNTLVEYIRKVEARTGLPLIVLVIMLLFGLTRLGLDLWTAV